MAFWVFPDGHGHTDVPVLQHVQRVRASIGIDVPGYADALGGTSDRLWLKVFVSTSGKPYFTQALTVLTGARWAHARLEHTYLDNQCVILQENNFVACTKT